MTSPHEPLEDSGLLGSDPAVGHQPSGAVPVPQDSRRPLPRPPVSLGPEAIERLREIRSLLDKGKLDAAELQGFRHMEQFGRSGEVLHTLGQIAARRRRHGLALKRLEAAAKNAPSAPLIRAHLAEALRMCGKTHRAIEAGREAVRLGPRIGETHNCLGLAFLNAQKNELAVKAFSNASELSPEVPHIWNNLGNALRQSSRLSSSIDAHRRALVLEPENDRYLRGLGQSLTEDSQHAEALTLFQLALEIHEDPEVWNQIGQIYNEMGQPNEAVPCFRKSLKLDPNFVPAYVNLAVHHRKDLTDEDQSEMSRILEDVELLGRQESGLRFARAALHDKAGEFDQAASEFRRANHVQKEWNEANQEGYDVNGQDKITANIRHAFDTTFFERRVGWGNPSERPVFVFGLPRSGTTLTEQILASHPNIYGAGERKISSQSYKGLPRRLGKELPPFRCVSELDQFQVDQIAEDHLKELERINSSSLRVVDKMPENIAYVGWLALQFPNAKFIRCIRDPRDVAVSCLITSFQSVRWSNFDPHLLHRFQKYRELVDHWAEVLPGRIMNVVYADTIADKDAQARRLIDWVGLPWDDACLDHTKNTGVVRTASVSQARRPIYKSSLARWEGYQASLSGLFAEICNILPDELHADT